MRWAFETFPEEEPDDTATVAGSTVFFGTYGWRAGTGGSIYALDAGTGTLRWRYGTVKDPWFPPTVAGRWAYVVDMAGWAYALDTDTGAERWRTRTAAARVVRPTLVAGGIVLALGDDGNVVGLLTALDAETGAERWRSTYDLDSAVAVANGAVHLRLGGVGHGFDAPSGSPAHALRGGTNGTGHDARR